MEIIPGIHQIKLPIPSLPSGEKSTGVLFSINIYLIEGEAGWVLVDTGMDIPLFLDMIVRELQHIGISFRHITKLVITHAHVDHFGLAYKLRKMSGAKVYLHQFETLCISEKGFKAQKIIKTMTEWLKKNGYPQKEIVTIQRLPSEKATYISFAYPDTFCYFIEVASPDIILTGNELIKAGNFNFEVLWTPGHAPGHICLYERARKIFLSGDHILPQITPAIALSPYSMPNPLGDYIRSLSRLKDLDVEFILPGHGDCNIDFQQRINELIQHHNERMEEILEALKETSKTVYEVSSDLTWMPGQGGIPWDRLDPWAHRLAFTETLAHLRLLEEKGQVKREVKEDLEFYRR